MNNQKKRILIVDDDPKLTRQLRFNLEHTGDFQVQEENRATHAVIAARGFLPDLILMDVLMPGIEGGDLASEIRSVPAFRALPIVFLTGNAATESEIYEHGGYIGGERFLHKPVALQDLINCINQELQKSAHQPVEQKPAEDSNPHFAY